jgi:hypothetical protein
MRREKSKRKASARMRVPMQGTGGGDARSRVEGSVMGLDRRGVIVRRYLVGNLKEEDRGE